MKQIYYSIIFSTFLFSCGQPQKNENSDSNNVSSYQLKQPAADTVRQAPAVNPYENSNIEVKTFQNSVDNEAKGTWGYDIYVNNGKSPSIHQPSIPSLSGNMGFNTEANARKTGEFVAHKIKHNIMPPTLNHHELDSLGVLN